MQADQAPEGVVDALKEYCKSCHAINPWKFISSNQTDDQIWNALFTQTVPQKNRTWAEAIVKVLQWPQDNPPAPATFVEPGVHWMPIGVNRNKLHLAKIGDKSTRLVII
jgi:hypothetical protein